jgi:hypothetical protein
MPQTLTLVFTSPSTVQVKTTLFFFLLVGLEFELRALHLQSRHSYHLNHTSSLFALGILEMESFELFAWSGLEPQSSGSQPPN